MKNNNIDAKINSVKNLKNMGFTKLVELSGLDPKIDFQHMDLNRADFTNCDLTDYNFSGSEIEHANFNGAKIIGSIFDESHFYLECLKAASDYNLFSKNILIRKRNQNSPAPKRT